MKMSDWIPPDFEQSAPTRPDPLSVFPAPTQAHPTLTPPLPPSQGQPPAAYFQPGIAPPPVGGPSTSKLAITALVFGLVGWIIPVAGGLLAVGFGIAGLIAVSRSAGWLTGKGLASVGLILGLLSASVWGSALASEGFRDGFADGLNEGFAETQPSRQLAVGDCLNVSLIESTDFQVDSGDVVDCAVPHHAQYAGSIFNPASAGAPYPGEDTAFNEALDLCLARFAEFVGTAYADERDLDLFLSYPQSFSWGTFDDRESGCFIVNLDESLMTGSVSKGT